MSKRSSKEKPDNFHWGGTSPFFYSSFISSFTPVDFANKTMLDLGCGRGVYGILTRTTRNMEKSKMIGLDTNDLYLSFCRRHRIYDKLINQKLPRIPLKDKSVDFLLSCELIEHLTKKEGKKLLDEIDRVCKGRAIVTTPNIFFQTIPGEEEDEHKSLWTVKEFRKQGYKVYGVGLKTTLLVDDPFLKIKQALYYVFTPMSYLIPEIGGGLICVKNF